MADPENRQSPISQETLPSGRDYPPAEQRQRPILDWKGYPLETLHALDV
jgi:hypothetical protein